MKITPGLLEERKKEQDFLVRQFGAAFEDDRRVTGFFLPRFF